MSSAVLTSPSVERVRDALSRAGLGSTIVELPGAARTAKVAAEYFGCAVAHTVFRLTYDELVRINRGAESDLA